MKELSYENREEVIAVCKRTPLQILSAKYATGKVSLYYYI